MMHEAHILRDQMSTPTMHMRVTQAEKAATSAPFQHVPVFTLPFPNGRLPEQPVTMISSYGLRVGKSLKLPHAEISGPILMTGCLLILAALMLRLVSNWIDQIASKLWNLRNRQSKTQSGKSMLTRLLDILFDIEEIPKDTEGSNAKLADQPKHGARNSGQPSADKQPYRRERGRSSSELTSTIPSLAPLTIPRSEANVHTDTRNDKQAGLRRDSVSSLRITADNPFITPMIITEWQTPKNHHLHSPRSVTNRGRRALFIGKAAQGAATALQQLQQQQQQQRLQEKSRRMSLSTASSSSSQCSASDAGDPMYALPKNAPIAVPGSLLGITAYAQRKLAGLAALRGYLEKRARSSLVGWQVRWFETHHAYLRYYHTEDRKAGLFLIDLRDVTEIGFDLRRRSRRSGEPSREFQIATPDRIFRLRAETAADAQVWVAHLRLRHKVLKQYCSGIKWPNNCPVTPRVANDDLALGYQSVTTSMIANLANASYNQTLLSQSPEAGLPPTPSVASTTAPSSSGSTTVPGEVVSRLSPVSANSLRSESIVSSASSMAVSSAGSESLLMATKNPHREFTETEKRLINWDSLTMQQQEAAIRLYNALPESNCSMVMRFLAARAWNYDEACKLLQEHLAWRRANLPIGPEEVRAELSKEKYALLGYDKLGRRIIIIFERRLGKHTYTSIEECTKALIFGLERLFQEKLGPTEQFVVIFNRVGGTKQNVDLDWARVVGSILQNNYPERLGAAYVAPVNLLFRGLWRIASLFFDPKTANKIKLLGSTSELLNYIDSDNLLEELGGKLKYHFDIEESLGYKDYISPRSQTRTPAPFSKSPSSISSGGIQDGVQSKDQQPRAVLPVKVASIPEADKTDEASAQHLAEAGIPTNTCTEGTARLDDLQLQRRFSTGSSTSVSSASSSLASSTMTPVLSSGSQKPSSSGTTLVETKHKPHQHPTNQPTNQPRSKCSDFVS